MVTAHNHFLHFHSVVLQHPYNSPQPHFLKNLQHPTAPKASTVRF